MFQTTIFSLLKMTLLSAQLMRMRQETTAALDVDKRTKITILFTPEEAAKISNEVILQLAQSGVETLKGTSYIVILKMSCRMFLCVNIFFLTL